MKLHALMAAIMMVCAVGVFAAERRAAATGDWSAKATWAGEAIPDDGDNVDIPDGMTVTVSDARIAGPSGDAGGVAINLNKTGALVIVKGGQLKVRGDVIYTGGQKNVEPAVTVQGGGQFRWDSTKAAKPAETHWRFRPSADFGFRAFVLAGSAEALAVLESEENGGAGVFTRDGKNFAGPFLAKFAKISRIGDDKTAGWDIFWFENGKKNEVVWDVQNTTISECGVIKIAAGNIEADGLFRHSRNIHERSRGPKAIFTSPPARKPIGPNGVREINNNIFDIAAVEMAFVDDYTITGNYFGRGFAGFHSSASWAKCERNLYRIFDQFCWVAGKRLADSVVFIDRDWDNPHVIFGAYNYQIDLDGLILSHAGTANMDSGEWIFCQPGCRNSIFLPNAYGYSSGEITASGGGAKGGYIFEHNTWFGGYGKGQTPAGKKAPPGFSAFQYSETGNNKPGDLKSFRSNLLWNPQLPGKESKFVKMCDIHGLYKDQKAGPPIEDVGNPKDLDHNASWGMDKDEEIDFPNKDHYKNWGKGYIGNWSKTPGEHDIDDADPQFVDYQRDLPLWATKALNKPASRGDWQAKPDKPYAVGDTVLNKTGIYWGLPILYRYIGDGQANPEPGAGTRKTGDASEWRKSWEWASLYYLREAIIKGEKIGDEEPLMHMIKWIRAGYAPTNPAYKAAAHDGQTIGAVPWTAKTEKKN